MRLRIEIDCLTIELNGKGYECREAEDINGEEIDTMLTLTKGKESEYIDEYWAGSLEEVRDFLVSSIEAINKGVDILEYNLANPTLYIA